MMEPLYSKLLHLEIEGKILAESESKFVTGYKLSDQALMDLKHREVPESFISKLDSIKNQAFKSSKELKEAIRSIVGHEEDVQFIELATRASRTKIEENVARSKTIRWLCNMEDTLKEYLPEDSGILASVENLRLKYESQELTHESAVSDASSLLAEVKFFHSISKSSAEFEEKKLKLEEHLKERIPVQIWNDYFRSWPVRIVVGIFVVTLGFMGFQVHSLSNIGSQAREMINEIKSEITKSENQLVEMQSQRKSIIDQMEDLKASALDSVDRKLKEVKLEISAEGGRLNEQLMAFTESQKDLIASELSSRKLIIERELNASNYKHTNQLQIQSDSLKNQLISQNTKLIDDLIQAQSTEREKLQINVKGIENQLANLREITNQNIDNTNFRVNEVEKRVSIIQRQLNKIDSVLVHAPKRLDWLQATSRKVQDSYEALSKQTSSKRLQEIVIILEWSSWIVIIAGILSLISIGISTFVLIRKRA